MYIALHGDDTFLKMAAVIQSVFVDLFLKYNQWDIHLCMFSLEFGYNVALLGTYG